MSKVVVQILRAPIGGIRKHVFDILEHMDAKGVEQIFVTNISDKDADLPAYEKLKIIHAPINDKPGVDDLSNLVSIYWELRKFKVDVIHGHGAKGGIYARILSFILGAKCIYTPHGGSLHRIYGKIKNKFYDFIEFCLIPLTDIYLFESNYTRNEFVKNIADPKDKSIVNYNGVEIPEKRSSKLYLAGEKLHIASFGLLRKLKGHDIAIKACVLLAAAQIPFSYTIYGRGEEKGALLELIKKWNLEDSVFIQDYAVNVLDEMLKYDFIIHPSRFESFGYVPAEAMSLEIPVVTSSEGGLREVVDEKCGYISLNNSPEEYFKIFSKIYQGDDTLKEKTDVALEKVERLFSRLVMLKKIEAIYKA
jgi:glycosyltransferase involved in cell wall biosynthesis